MLFDGFTNGFKLYYHGTRMSLDTTNLKSVLFNTDVAISKVKNEILESRIAGPFNVRHIYNLLCSPIGLVPKKLGCFRLIKHISYPSENSVNHFIDEKFTSVNYSSFDNVETWARSFNW